MLLDLLDRIVRGTEPVQSASEIPPVLRFRSGTETTVARRRHTNGRDRTLLLRMRLDPCVTLRVEPSMAQTKCQAAMVEEASLLLLQLLLRTGVSRNRGSRDPANLVVTRCYAAFVSHYKPWWKVRRDVSPEGYLSI